MGNLVSTDTTPTLLLHSKLNHCHDEEEFNNSKCTNGELSPSHSDANGGAHSLSVEEEDLLCFLNQNYVEKTRTVLDFLYYLKKCIEGAGGIEHLVKEITRSLKSKEYKKTEENAAKFLSSTTPFTKQLLLKMCAVRVILHSMLEELKAKLEAKQERFRKRKVIWKRIYRSVAVALSVCSGLLLFLAAPHATIAAVPLVVAVSTLCDHALESRTESLEATFKNDEEIVTATSSIAGENGLQIVRNKVKEVVDVVRTVSRCSEIFWTDDSVLVKVKEIDEALKELKSSLKGIKSEVKRTIVSLEKTVKIHPLTRSRARNI